MKLNCWEFKKCGRQLGGIHVSDLGICPAAQETRLNDVHGGSNAGRSCFLQFRRGISPTSALPLQIGTPGKHEKFSGWPEK